jgi:hypothetical protein
MPTKRERTTRLRTPDIEPWKIEFLLTGRPPEAPTPGKSDNSAIGWAFFHWLGSGDMSRVKQDWDEWKAVLVPEWIELHPGSRPIGWWLFDSPTPARTPYALPDFETESELERLDRYNLLTPDERERRWGDL